MDSGFLCLMNTGFLKSRQERDSVPLSLPLLGYNCPHLRLVGTSTGKKEEFEA